MSRDDLDCIEALDFPTQRRADTVDAMFDKAKTLVEQVLKPLLAVDGGAIELVDVVERRVRVKLGGSYSGCPGRPFVVRGVVEPAFRTWLGSDYVVEVVA